MSEKNHNTTEEIFSHVGERKVQLTVVKGAPYWSELMNKRFDTKKEGEVEEAKELAKRKKRRMERKLKDLQKYGIGGNKIKFRKRR